MTEPDYTQYTLSDFLNDDSFVQWVVSQDPASDPFWETFLIQFPEKKEMFEQAVSLITTYRKQDFFSNTQHQNVVWERITSSLEKPETRQRTIPFYYKIAAAITLLFVAGAVFRLMSPPDQKMEAFSTSFGEIKTVKLPDGSAVTLNGNSVLRYAKTWPEDTPREVWLEGEAYFDVQHLNKNTSAIVPHDRFIVHSDEMEVEVLGTTFNVEHRRDEMDITLITGRVKVGPSDSASPKDDLLMQPGDQVEYQNTRLINRKKLQRPTLAMAWINREFVFIDPYLRDIVRTLEDDHGYTIEVKGEKLLELKIEGEINVVSVKELLSTVETTLGLTIKQSDKKLVISRK